MGRLSISELPVPADAFRIDLLPNAPDEGAWFESEADKRVEDALRAKRIDPTAGKLKRKRRRKLKLYNSVAASDLKSRLSYGPGNDPPPTLASALWMRDARVRITGALWELVESRRFSDVRSFTAIPRGWEIEPGALGSKKAAKLLAQFRSDLNRAGAKGATGFLVASVHGEFEPTRGVYILHIHGIATDDFIAILAKIKKKNRKYKHENGDAIRNRLRRVRIKPETLPYPLSYPFKSFWPARRIGPVGEDDEVKRERAYHRIPEPYHTQVLLWHDQQRLRDTVLLLKLSVSKRGLVYTGQKPLRTPKP